MRAFKVYDRSCRLTEQVLQSACHGQCPQVTRTTSQRALAQRSRLQVVTLAFGIHVDVVSPIIMLSACTRVHSRAHAGGGLPPALFRSRSKSGCFTSPRMNTKSASSAAANPPADPLMDKTDALRMLKFINYAWTPYHVVGMFTLWSSTHDLRAVVCSLPASYHFNRQSIRLKRQLFCVLWQCI